MNAKRLSAIPRLDKTAIDLLVKLIKGKVQPEDVSAQCKKMVLSCYSEPSWETKVMYAANEIIDGHGVEYIDDPNSFTECSAMYVNMGETYTTTLMFDFESDKFIVSSWGDFVEATQYF